MNWTRYKLLIFTGGVTVVVSGVLLFWLLSSAGENEELRSEITRLTSRETTLRAADPYPSKENFEQLQAAQATVAEKRTQLMEAVRERQVNPPQMIRSRFGDYVKTDLVPGLVQAAKEATRGGEQGVVLKDPAFGLQDYLSGTLPESQEIPRLMVRLETMKHLSTLLFESGISELVRIDKPEEKVPDGAPRARGLRGALPGLAGAQPVEAEEEEDTRSRLEKQADRMFETVEFRMEFRVYEDFFWTVLNNLMADTNQVAIRRLVVTNGNQKIWPDYLEPVMTGVSRSSSNRQEERRDRSRGMTDLERQLNRMAGGEAPVAEGRDSGAAMAGLQERRQHITGGDLLNVVMDVVVYRLKAETPETNQGS